MTQSLYSVALAVAAFGLTFPARGQISLTPGNLTYSQNFDTLTRSTTAEAWADNVAMPSVNDSPQVVGLPGWYAGNFGTTALASQIRAGTGSSTSGSFYSFGAALAEDRALGTLPVDSVASASMRFATRFVNNTGDVLNGFSFTYDGEQWRQGAVTAANNQFVVAYAIFAAGSGSLDATNYGANLSGATFNTPADGTGVGGLLDGNAAANRVAGLGATVSGLEIAPGAELWLRWFDSNSTGADHGIAVDNFAIAFAVPEPTAVLVLGMGLVLLSQRMRRANRA